MFTSSLLSPHPVVNMFTGSSMQRNGLSFMKVQEEMTEEKQLQLVRRIVLFLAETREKMTEARLKEKFNSEIPMERLRT